MGASEPGRDAPAYRLERGSLALSIVVDGIPVGDLPAGARLRIGEAAVVELRARHRTGVGPASPESPGTAGRPGGLVEAGAHDPVEAEVLEPGSVAPGDGVVLDAVAVPLTDVLDLHSFRPEDTERVVTEYLAAARRAGLGEVRIIHGRGRGVQRAIIRRLLAQTPGVDGFAEAPPARGGWGATLVRLRRREDAPSA
ncbi:MAG TPA: Smr/MutS family protein [Methylomirabilota bacterium]